MKRKNIVQKETVAAPLANFKDKTTDDDTLQTWRPDYKWLANTAGIILAALIILFFTLNLLLKPYMRQIPKEITPWLYSGGDSNEK
ncbi:MAG: hypothetical protein LBQ47_08400 [Endomicrobium sp.]|jgi:ABC-type glycerol-3-phosphate transport system permease component|nr:hypothetical protein [Endomicrobium sp.]